MLWLKRLVVVDTQSQLVLAQEACSRIPTAARPCRARWRMLPTHSDRLVGLGRAEFDSERNHLHVHEKIECRVRSQPSAVGRAGMRAEFPTQAVPTQSDGGKRLIGGGA